MIPIRNRKNAFILFFPFALVHSIHRAIHPLTHCIINVRLRRIVKEKKGKEEKYIKKAKGVKKI